MSSDIPNNALLVRGNTVPFNNQPGNPKVSLLRAEVNRVVLQGDNFILPVPPNFLEDQHVAVEPREQNVVEDQHVAVEPREQNFSWLEPTVIKNEEGFLVIPNLSNNAIKFKRNQVIGQIRSVIIPDEAPTLNTTNVSVKTTQVKNYIDLIQIDPDAILTVDQKMYLQNVTMGYSSIFTPNFGTYNGKSGDIYADVILGKNMPMPKKGKVPVYNPKNSNILQDKFDELVELGVWSRPEDVNATVVHTSPSFLVKKPNGSHRLVTSFVELNKYICPLPSKLNTTADVLTALGRWKYIIKTDLKSSYFQMKMTPC